MCRLHTGAAAHRQSGADRRPAVVRSPRNDWSVRPEPRRRPVGRWRCGRRAVERGGFDDRSAGHQPAPASHIGTDEPSGHDHSTVHTCTAVFAGDNAPDNAPNHAADNAAYDAADDDTNGDDHGHPGRYGLADAVSDAVPAGGERADLVQALDRHRFFLRNTLRGLTDKQAAERTTVSELTLAGLIKHVTQTERQWCRFIVEGPSGMRGAADPEQALADWRNGFCMLEGETVDSLLAAYDRVAREADELVLSLPDLDASQPLPPEPWFEPGARWSARRVVLHIIAETSQHAGHADIIRESLDGAKSMG
jgi:hypothetical protein